MHQVGGFQRASGFVSLRRLAVFLGGIRSDAVHRLEAALYPHRVAGDGGVRTLEKLLDQALVAPSLAAEQQAGQPQRSFWASVKASVKHVFVKPTRRFEAVVVNRHPGWNLGQDFERSFAHRQVDGVKIAPRDGHLRPCGFGGFACGSGDFGHGTGWPCQRLCRGEQADISIVKEFVGVFRKVKRGKGNVPPLVDGTQQLEQFPLGSTQGAKGAPNDEDARALGRLSLVLSHRWEALPLPFQIHPPMSLCGRFSNSRGTRPFEKGRHLR